MVAEDRGASALEVSLQAHRAQGDPSQADGPAQNTPKPKSPMMIATM